jgi:hypothetical protein
MSLISIISANVGQIVALTVLRCLQRDAIDRQTLLQTKAAEGRQCHAILRLHQVPFGCIGLYHFFKSKLS